MLVFRRTILLALAFLWKVSLGYCFPLPTVQSDSMRKMRTSEIRVSARGQRIFGKQPVALWRKTESTIPLEHKALGATSQPSEYPAQLTAAAAFDFPSTRECYRNLTRAIEYSIVIDSDDGSQDLNFYDRLSTTPLEHFLQEQQRMRVTSMCDMHSSHKGAPKSSFGWIFPKRHSKRLGFIVLWWQSLISKRMAHFVQKLVRPLWKNKNTNKGFYTSGTKRHYALLVACLVNGDLCGHYWQKDPLAYHRSIVESAHHRTIASLSPSTLSLRTNSIATSRSRIHVSALESHALQWALKRRHTRGKLHEVKEPAPE